MPLTKYGDISPRTAGFAAAKLLDVAQPLLTTERFGQFDPQGKNKTKTRKWRRYESFPPAIAPLSEGITPEAQVPTYTDVTATLERQGVEKFSDSLAELIDGLNAKSGELVPA